MFYSGEWFLIIMFVASMPHFFAEMCRSKCGVPSDWIAVERNICYGTSGNKYAKISLKDDCHLFAVRLSHVSGFQTADKANSKTRSRWGLDADYSETFATILLRDNKLWIPQQTHPNNGGYKLKGFTIDDDVIVLKRNATLSIGSELQVAFGRDFIDQSGRNDGVHCIDVDISCII